MRMCMYCIEGACIAANCNGIRRWIAQVGRRAQSKMWEFEVLMRDSGSLVPMPSLRIGVLVNSPSLSL